MINQKDLNHINNLGLTASASAPEILVQNFINFLQKNYKINVHESDYIPENISFKIPPQLKEIV